ncbi:MAG TPA: hypothetical protein VFN71_14800 [Methylomirabilota bacterium]|nr:hypothetical protein [Methylomirabilota bacterium]
MIRPLLAAGALGVVLAGWAHAQTFTPQSPTALSVTFSTERAGGTRVLIFGEVRNSANHPAERVTLMAEGLDESGRVVSRSRGYVSGLVPSRGSAPFEIRLLSAGSEKRYRVQVESFQFQIGGQ